MLKKIKQLLGKESDSLLNYKSVINKRAGGTGLISGRKAFQRPMKEGIELLNSTQDVYLCREIGIA